MPPGEVGERMRVSGGVDNLTVTSSPWPVVINEVTLLAIANRTYNGLSTEEGRGATAAAEGSDWFTEIKGTITAGFSSSGMDIAGRLSAMVTIERFAFDKESDKLTVYVEGNAELAIGPNKMKPFLVAAGHFNHLYGCEPEEVEIGQYPEPAGSGSLRVSLNFAKIVVKNIELRADFYCAGQDIVLKKDYLRDVLGMVVYEEEDYESLYVDAELNEEKEEEGDDAFRANITHTMTIGMESLAVDAFTVKDLRGQLDIYRTRDDDEVNELDVKFFRATLQGTLVIGEVTVSAQVGIDTLGKGVKALGGKVVWKTTLSSAEKISVDGGGVIKSPCEKMGDLDFSATVEISNIRAADLDWLPKTISAAGSFKSDCKGSWQLMIEITLPTKVIIPVIPGIITVPLPEKIAFVVQKKKVSDSVARMTYGVEATIGKMMIDLYTSKATGDPHRVWEGGVAIKDCTIGELIGTLGLFIPALKGNEDVITNNAAAMLGQMHSIHREHFASHH
mmetsp:Transcript_19144/g.47771  ORF Transcript_19144/g.47771 Transcript_19144/m.47771 type:complete len:504 (+) Transcript_19144:1195-2706(+)